MNDRPRNLADGLAAEIERCRELLEEYRGLPDNAGAFAAAIINASVTEAVNAQASGDVVRMMIAYERLTGHE